jgi:NAD+ kinase
VRAGEFDLLIIAGGDGSVLRAGHLCAPSGVPILGVNLGRIGFLIQVDRGEWREYFDKLLDGEAWIENRMMIHADHVRAGENVGSWDALNEVVVGRGQNLRPVKLTASVDGRQLTSYVADGLIASTPPARPPTPSPRADPSCRRNCATSCWCRSPRISPWTVRLSSLRVPPSASSVRSENSIMSVDGQPPINLLEDDTREHVARRM